MHLNIPFLIKNEMGKNRVWSYAAAFRTLSIASVISNQRIATQRCIQLEQIILSAFPLS